MTHGRVTVPHTKGLLTQGVFDAQRGNIRAPYYVLRHSHVIKWGAVIGHNDETGDPILLTFTYILCQFISRDKGARREFSQWGIFPPNFQFPTLGKLLIRSNEVWVVQKNGRDFLFHHGTFGGDLATHGRERRETLIFFVFFLCFSSFLHWQICVNGNAI